MHHTDTIDFDVVLAGASKSASMLGRHLQSPVIALWSPASAIRGRLDLTVAS